MSPQKQKQKRPDATLPVSWLKCTWQTRHPPPETTIKVQVSAISWHFWNDSVMMMEDWQFKRIRNCNYYWVTRFHCYESGEIWSYFHRFYCFPEPLFVSQSSWPWTSFCFRGFWFMSINPVLMSTGASVVSLSPIFISQSSLLSCWSASGSLLAALNSWCISMHALFGLLRSLRCLFPCVLVVFLCSLFVSCIVYLYPEVHYFFPNSVFHVDFPEFFFSHIPELLSRFWISLHISLHFVSSFISLFISIGSLCLFLWILICFSESEPLVFSSLAKTHKLVKLKRRPQMMTKCVCWKCKIGEKLWKHMHYLLAIIESSSFVCSLVASLVVSHHWRPRFHLITYCSSASCCKAVRSSCFLFTLHAGTYREAGNGFKFHPDS